MNKLIRNCFVLILALIAGMVWLDAMAGKPTKVTVTSAFPDFAIQGDDEEVEIEGTGFDEGSTARFIVTDTRDDTQITVLEPPVFDKATGKLKAKIRVRDAALPVEYDIEVMTSSGRRGKGTTMFRVRERDNAGPVQLGPEDDIWPGPGDDNSGEDNVSGGAGDDLIDGGLGDDYLYGEDGRDSLHGGDGNDYFDGGPGYDLLFGGAGDDRFDLPVFGGSDMDYVDGGDGSDTMRLHVLEYVELDARIGEYTGHYFVVDGKTSTQVNVSGEFDDVETILCATRGGVYHGDESDNDFLGYGGENIMYGHGGNDQMNGGFAGESADYINGGDGDDILQGVYGDDWLVGGTGKDTFFIRKGLGHDVVEDFTIGDDIISIFNSDVCFEDLHLSLVEAGGDSGVGDTYITWRVKRKLNTVSITLLDVEPQELSELDFDFTWDPLAEYSSDCP